MQNLRLTCLNAQTGKAFQACFLFVVSHVPLKYAPSVKAKAAPESAHLHIVRKACLNSRTTMREHRFLRQIRLHPPSRSRSTLSRLNADLPWLWKFIRRLTKDDFALQNLSLTRLNAQTGDILLRINRLRKAVPMKYHTAKR